VRLFLALQIPPAVRKNLAEFLAELRALSSQPRWVRAENLHVTLKFIGEVQPDKLKATRRALSAVHSGQEVALDFRGLGFFPNEKRPRVFWAGIEASTNLVQLASDVDRVLAELGFPPEKRPFSAHLTLARFEPPGAPQNLRAVIRENAKREFGSVAAKEFHLIESKLKPGGAEYTTLETFPFVVAEA
jgi:RNA 2',3'-cyclic 3'-phosphodiesterase